MAAGAAHSYMKSTSKNCIMFFHQGHSSKQSKARPSLSSPVHHLSQIQISRGRSMTTSTMETPEMVPLPLTSSRYLQVKTPTRRTEEQQGTQGAKSVKLMRPKRSIRLGCLNHFLVLWHIPVTFPRSCPYHSGTLVTRVTVACASPIRMLSP